MKGFSCPDHLQERWCIKRCTEARRLCLQTFALLSEQNFPSHMVFAHRHLRQWETDSKVKEKLAVCKTVYQLFFFNVNSGGLNLCHEVLKTTQIWFFLLTVNTWNKVMSWTSEVVTAVKVKWENTAVEPRLCPFWSMYCLRESSLLLSKGLSSSEYLH